MSEQQLITLTTHLNALEAHIIKGRLEAEGVLTFSQFENHIWAYWSLAQALGGVRVMVRADSEQTASKIVNDIEDGLYSSLVTEEFGEEPFIECPHCHSVNTIESSWSRKFALVMLIVFSLPLPFSRHEMKCKDCKRVWPWRMDREYPIVIPLLYIFSMAYIMLALYALLRCGCVECLYING